MHDTSFLREMLLLLAMAVAGAAVFARLKLPTIAGFLAAGALAGPGGLALVEDPERVRLLAEFGVVFLLFEIGLELPLERLRVLWRPAFVAGGLQVGLTLTCVTGAGIALGLGTSQSLVLGGLVAMSSTALVIRLLSDRGTVNAPHGQIMVGILLFQDLCIVPFLLALPLLATGGEDLIFVLGRAVFQLGAALAVFFLAVRFVLPGLLERFVVLRSQELFTLFVLVVVVGSAVLAEEIGLTLAVGAFVAGLVASASPYSTQLFAEVVPLRGVLLGIFFTAVGMLFDPIAALGAWSGVLAYVFAVVALKAGVVIAVVAGVLRRGLRIGIESGLGLAQTGEFSFVLAGAAAAVGLLNAEIQQIFIAGSVLTLVATPFLFNLASYLVERLARDGGGRPGVEEFAGHLSGHALIVGFGLGGRTLARVFRALDVPYVIADVNPVSVGRALERGENIVYGDAARPAFLRHLGAPRARLVAVAINDPDAARRVVTLARSMAPRATIVVRAPYVADVDALVVAGADTVVAAEVEATLDLVAQTLGVFGVTAGAAERFVAELREEGYAALRGPLGERLDPWLVETLDQVSTEWLEVPEDFPGEAGIAELGIRARTGASVLAVDRGGSNVPNPSPEFALRARDRLLVSGTPEAVAALRRLLEQAAAQPPQPASER